MFVIAGGWEFVTKLQYFHDPWSPLDLGEKVEPALDALVHNVGVGAAGADGLAHGGVYSLEGFGALVRRLDGVFGGACLRKSSAEECCVIFIEIVNVSIHN